MTLPARLVLSGQIIFWTGMVLCTLLLPQFAFSSNQGDVSNYGVHLRTIVPFSVAFWGCSILSVLAGWRIKPATAPSRQAKVVLLLLGLFLALTAATTYPYKINRFYDTLHIAASIALFFVQLGMGVWAWLRAGGQAAHWWFGVLVFGFILSALTFLGVLHVLFIGEMVTGVGFGALLVVAVEHITSQPTAQQ